MNNKLDDNRNEISGYSGSGIDILCKNSIELINYARSLAVRQINIVELMTNYALGRWIIEEQQNGSERARYGASVIKRLSEAFRLFAIEKSEPVVSFFQDNTLPFSLP